MLTIAYVTNRLYPCWHWFFDSLANELRATPTEVRIVVVDQHKEDRELPAHVVHVAPKPCVWQGPHRLTTRDYFAAANARNTALCLAPDGWIVYVDDVSVLMPGWLARVRQAMDEGYVACGAYRKVNGLDVVDGVVKSFSDHPHGHDSRWSQGSDTEAVRHGPGILYGCSVAAPVEWFLDVNGWEEKCDGMGYEDSVMGIMLMKKNRELRYDRRMLTLESVELHYQGEVAVRVDKKMVAFPDASHAILHQTKTGNGRAQNLFDIRELRQQVLSGSPFPIPTRPAKHWPDGQPLGEM